ncbi:riboflavin synthase subunit beta [Cyanidioschyzon merolae strain 10D]|jgi:6,7-dimethyl-8-ribityllumazine synthase|uniref:6,7-dimethyl-8-ribityllumazine synthase n=1 Tax=Cyanidioschyzon merolae (strain NIES-3377 / 10D) TaxID=280699 RepID=M1VC82_CYAM1|nr:riboflavin synthase subunit beta [Cyanidioschyzon merolae strain 10D]BAM80107.1 riboflavin synthase subunit beta [Cyanidioschyzon merolae strain 10D]|eukprot:XP_005536393.1 riboflavin synthase subunit beta [Cyanidioschyzon merolae strain 10D]
MFVFSSSFITRRAHLASRVSQRTSQFDWVTAYSNRCACSKRFQAGPTHRTESIRHNNALGLQSATKRVTFSDTLDGSDLRIGLVRSRWNEEITGSLLEGAKRTLRECKVSPENIVELEVPGAFELPLGARLMIETQRVDAVVCLGCLIKGETTHFDVIADKASAAIMQLQMTTAVPIVFGVLTCLSEEQARARAMGPDNLAVDWAKTAVEMGVVKNVMQGKRPAGKESKKLLF